MTKMTALGTSGGLPQPGTDNWEETGEVSYGLVFSFSKVVSLTGVL